MKFSGVLVATITPFDREGSLSLQTLRAHLDFLLDAGVHGFVPCGTTGEGPVLSRAERHAVIQLTKEVAERKKLPVIAGCGGNDTNHVLELLKEAEEMKCDAALVVTPYYNKPTQAGLLAHYTKLADRSRIPLVLYDVPGRTGVALAPETSAKLLEHRNIVGIKDASGSHANWLALANRMDLDKKALLAGDDDALAFVQALGGSGTISASANLVPGLFVQMYEHGRKGEWEAAFGLQRKVFPLVKALFAESNPAPLKYALHRARNVENILRLPLVPVTAATETLLQNAMKAVEVGERA